MDYEDMNEEELPQEDEELMGAEQPQDEEEQPQPEQARIDARPRNNIYMPGTGKGTGRTAVRVGTINRDGSASPVSALGAATGPLSQPIARFSPDQLQQMAEQNQGGGGAGSGAGGFGARPGRIDARPRNNIYMPGTGPGTGRTAIRVGTLNRDGSASPVSALGAATGPLSQPIAKFSPDQLQQMAGQNQGGGGADDYGDGGGAGSGAGGFGSRPGRIDARPRNNIYMPGTGPGTGRTAIRVGTLNRDGSASPVSALGAATGPLSQPIAKFSPDQLQQMAGQNQGGGGGADDYGDGGGAGNGAGGFGARPGRIDARPRNNIYMPGTGPGTGRTAIRVGTLNRDGSASPVSALGAATGPLSQPQSRLFEQRQPTSDFVQQRQANVANAKANGSFDAIRDKFNSSNAGHYMDESGAISQRAAGGASGAGQFVSAPDGQGGNKMVRLPGKPAAVVPPASAAPAPAAATPPAPATTTTPAPAAASPAATTPPRPPLAAAGSAPKTSFADALVQGVVPGAAKPAAAAAPAAPKPPLAAAGSVMPNPAAGGAPAGSAPLPPLTGNLLKGVMGTPTPKPPLAGAANVAPKPPLAAAANAAPAAAAVPPSASKATFEGQSRESFFGAAAQRQQMDNKYAKWKVKP